MEQIAIKKRMDEIVETVKAKEEEIEELQALLEARVADLNLSFERKKNTLEEAIVYLKGELRALFEKVDTKDTKTQRKVTLLSGDVIIKRPTKTLVYDKKLLEKWAQKEAPDLIEVKEIKEFKWATFKEKVLIEDNHIINVETGEALCIEGLTFKEVEEQLIIK